MATAARSIEELINREYEYGFVTDIEADTVPPRPERGHHPAHLGQEGRAGVHARVAAEGLPPLADDDGAELAERPLPADRLPGHHLLLGAEDAKTGPKSLDEVDPELLETYEKLGIPLQRAASCSPASRSTRSSTASRWPPPSRSKLAELGIIFCSFSEAVQRAPGAGAEVPRLGRAVHATTSSPRSTRRSSATARSVYVPQGRALPDGAVDLLPHQRRQHRPVRAHADHRRRGRLRQLPRGLHGADARREPAARRGGRAGRARRRADQVLDGAELVPGRQGGQGRHLQLRHQARQVPRARTRRSPGRRSRPARRSPGSTRAASCRATTRSASSTRWR